MEPGKKETYSIQYNIQQLNNVAIGDSYVKKITHELHNIDINQTNDSADSDII